MQEIKYCIRHLSVVIKQFLQFFLKQLFFIIIIVHILLALITLINTFHTIAN